MSFRAAASLPALRRVLAVLPPAGVHVWLAAGTTEMRRGMNGLALQVQQTLQRDPHAGDAYVFRGVEAMRPFLRVKPVRARTLRSG